MARCMEMPVKMDHVRMRWLFQYLPGAFVHRAGIFFAALLFLPLPMPAYSVLTHEAIIDSAWDRSIQPLLLRRFPQSSPDDLLHSHAYAYAGCILQDMGYYPFGSHFFSDLVHYVRSGDFVVNLVRTSENLDEYAFALGALAHYAADTEGHSIAVNRSVAMQYPKLAQKFGDRPTYADKPSAHLEVEFSFDVLQVAHGNYAPKAYHDFIGFAVSRPVLERAFRQTYSLEISDVFTNVDLAFSTYRRAVSSVIPIMTRAAWQIKKADLKKAQPRVNRRAFVYNLSRASYRKEWGRDFTEPGFKTRVVAFLLRILPKIGPLKALAFKNPTPQMDLLFQTSFDRTMEVYRGLLGAVGSSTLTLANRDFDTGEITRPTEYKLADNAYCELAIALARKDASAVDPQLRRNVLEFFRDTSLPFATKANVSRWNDTLAAIEKLKASAP
jgi:Zinc dependent phospholipase C